MTPSRKLYPTDVSDEEWAFVAPYLILLPEDADNERTTCARLPATLAGLHLVVFACLMLHHWMAFSGPTSRHAQEQETPVRR